MHKKAALFANYILSNTGLPFMNWVANAAVKQSPAPVVSTIGRPFVSFTAEQGITD